MNFKVANFLLIDEKLCLNYKVRKKHDNFFSFLTLIWVGKGKNQPSCPVFLNDSETVNAISLAFCSIQ